MKKLIESPVFRAGLLGLAINVGAVACTSDGSDSASKTTETTEQTTPTSEARKQGPFPHEAILKVDVEKRLLDAYMSFTEQGDIPEHTVSGPLQMYELMHENRDGSIIRMHLSSEEVINFSDPDNINRISAQRYLPGAGVVSSDNPNGNLVIADVDLFSLLIDDVVRKDATAGIGADTRYSTQVDIVDGSTYANPTPVEGAQGVADAVSVVLGDASLK